jgi:hypothetical protein
LLRNNLFEAPALLHSGQVVSIGMAAVLVLARVKDPARRARRHLADKTVSSS